jgi:hypothetical protein
MAAVSSFHKPWKLAYGGVPEPAQWESHFLNQPAATQTMILK